MDNDANQSLSIQHTARPLQALENKPERVSAGMSNRLGSVEQVDELNQGLQEQFNSWQGWLVKKNNELATIWSQEEASKTL